MQASVVCSSTDQFVPESSPESAKSPAQPPVISPGRVKLLLLAIASGTMLWMCHFPVAWGWLGWIALVPLLAIIHTPVRPRLRYFCAWLAGTVYFWPAISWMTVADTRMIACWAALSLYCSLYFPLAVFLVRRLERSTRMPLVLTFPAVWTGLEFVRALLGTGFPWYFLAHTQHKVLPVIQIADVAGAFGVSFVVASVNVVVFLGLIRLPRARQLLAMNEIECASNSWGFYSQAGWAALLLGATLGYGAYCLSHDQFEPGPRIALLQGNLDQRLKLATEFDAAAVANVRAAYSNLCEQAARLQPRPELIVWPETSYPEPWVIVAPDVDLAKQPEIFRRNLDMDQEMVRIMAKVARTNVLLGLNTNVLDYDNKMYRYNSALLLNGRGMDVGRYDKIHRVPFGEYVPLRDWLPFLNRFAPYDFDYSIRCGPGLTRLELGKYHFGVVVCYEDTDPFMARDYGVATADGPAVDFLVNISNDGWFDGSSEHEEHLAISRFRAIETRRTLLRSVNMGISAVIDSNGRVIAPVKQAVPGGADVWTIPNNSEKQSTLAPDRWGTYKQTEGIVVVDVPLDHRTSFYAAYGDWLPYSCWTLISVGLVLGWLPGRRLTC